MSIALWSAGVLPLVWPTTGHAAPGAGCIGDCDHNGSVTIDELVRAASIILGLSPFSECTAIDATGDGIATIDELVVAADRALRGCVTASPTATATATIIATPSPTPEPTVAPELEISAPVHGSFTLALTTAVRGRLRNAGTGQVLTVNGQRIPIRADETFSTVIALQRNQIFQPILVEVRSAEGRLLARDRRVIIAGQRVRDGGLSPRSLALRFNNSGFAQLASVLPTLTSIDAAALIAPGTVLISDYCIQRVFGQCLQRVDVVARGARFDGFAIDLEAMTGFLTATINITGLRVSVTIRGGIVNCDTAITAARATLVGNYSLAPLATDAAQIDVTQIGDVGVSLAKFDYNFTSGICSIGPIEALIGTIVGDIAPRVRSGLIDYLRDPDGSGPEDAPIVQPLQAALASAQLTDPIGEALGVQLDAPFFEVVTDGDGMTLGTDVSMTAPRPAPEAPDLKASYHVFEPFPILGGTTPEGHQPYDLGLCISTSAFNQLLKAQVENGLLTRDITRLNAGGTSLPITAGLLAAVVPEFEALDPALPLTVRLRPTLAPILTGSRGPGGELAELRVSHFLVDVLSAATDGATLYIRIAVDLRAGLDLTFDDAGDVAFSLHAPAAGDVGLTILTNPINADEAVLQIRLPGLLTQALPLFGSSLGSFPIPELLGLQPRGVEIARTPQMCVFLALN